MEIERIVWERVKPDSFPCFACQEKEAEFKAKFQYEEIPVNLCLCQECVKLSETELIEKIFGGKQHGYE